MKPKQGLPLLLALSISGCGGLPDNPADLSHQDFAGVSERQARLQRAIVERSVAMNPACPASDIAATPGVKETERRLRRRDGKEVPEIYVLTYRFTRCEQKLSQHVFIRSMAAGPSTVVLGVPGQTAMTADRELEYLGRLPAVVPALLDRPQCQETIVLDTRNAGRIPPVSGAPAADREDWLVEACGRRAVVPIYRWVDPSGTVHDAQSLSRLELAKPVVWP